MENNFNVYNNDEDMLEAIKLFSQNIDAQQLTSNDNLISCPFQFNADNSFRECLFRRCMAYRTDGEVFWCARLDQRPCDKNNLHSIEILT